ncbi:ABC transporter permease subunit [Streptosporangium sp. G11]|uniref:ABC transporter permease subunit n=1 Tax=Streptosporangium sp. G11 TaxID=3436926 RepID=UPI003EB95EF6
MSGSTQSRSVLGSCSGRDGIELLSSEGDEGSAARRRTPAQKAGRLDQGITLTSLVALSIPSFTLSILLLYGFAVALAAAQAAIVVRQMRAAALDLAAQDFLAFARARGLPRQRVWVSYALRNAALPVLTVRQRGRPVGPGGQRTARIRRPAGQRAMPVAW